tara:strand:+ start:1359 stop:2000 length:642 start_codon:yes stop_codon:yes gene_type:complete
MSRTKRIEEALSRSVCGGWDRSFLESILHQLTKKRPLSLKQRQTLGKVLARNSPDAESTHQSWAEEYKTEYEGAAFILGAYHKLQPYYERMANDILDGRVPERSKFLRMYDNKYSKKVLAQAAADAKYDVGEYLKTRAIFSSYKHVEFEGDILWVRQNQIIQKFAKRGGFVIEILKNIHSAAKGAKRYKLLPIGESTPIIIEERYLKKTRQKR